MKVTFMGHASGWVGPSELHERYDDEPVSRWWFYLLCLCILTFDNSISNFLSFGVMNIMFDIFDDSGINRDQFVSRSSNSSFSQPWSFKTLNMQQTLKSMPLYSHRGGRSTELSMPIGDRCQTNQFLQAWKTLSSAVQRQGYVSRMWNSKSSSFILVCSPCKLAQSRWVKSPYFPVRARDTNKSRGPLEKGWRHFPKEKHDAQVRKSLVRLFKPIIYCLERILQYNNNRKLGTPYRQETHSRFCKVQGQFNFSSLRHFPKRKRRALLWHRS